MAAVTNFFKNIAMNPMETIEFVVPVILLISGLWAALYAPLGGTLAERASQGQQAWAVGLGIAHLLLALPLLYAVIWKNWPQSLKTRRLLSFGCFLLLMFYGFAGLFVNGLHRISWVSAFGLAVIAGVCHIRLKWDYDA